MLGGPQMIQDEQFSDDEDLQVPGPCVTHIQGRELGCVMRPWYWQWSVVVGGWWFA